MPDSRSAAGFSEMAEHHGRHISECHARSWTVQHEPKVGPEVGDELPVLPLLPASNQNNPLHTPPSLPGYMSHSGRAQIHSYSYSLLLPLFQIW